MPLLYEYLQVDSNATPETIEKSYKILAYKYIHEQNSESLQNINNAYQILKDPYKRDFYDRFGDFYIANLSNPTESFFISRFFTLFNICLMCASFLSFVCNYFFLGLIFTYFPKISPTLIFIPFILAPLFLIPVIIHSYSLLSHQNTYHSKLIHIAAILLTFSASIFIISYNISIFAMITNELIQLVFIYLLSSNLNIKVPYILGIFVFKSYTLTLFYTDWTTLKYFVPCLSILGTAVIHFALPIIFILLLFPNCLGIYLVRETDFINVAAYFNIIHAFIGIIILLFVFSIFVSPQKKVPINLYLDAPV